MTGWAPPQGYDPQKVCRMCQHGLIAHADVEEITNARGCWPIRRAMEEGRRCACTGFKPASKAFKHLTPELL